PRTRRPNPHTLPLHDALPIWAAPNELIERDRRSVGDVEGRLGAPGRQSCEIIAMLAHQPADALAFAAQHDGNAVAEIESGEARTDRKSTRLNSSHQIISYAVF